jgi:hypothetical protein
LARKIAESDEDSPDPEMARLGEAAMAQIDKNMPTPIWRDKEGLQGRPDRERTDPRHDCHYVLVILPDLVPLRPRLATFACAVV